MRTTHRALVLALTWLAGQAAHQTGDYLIQRDCDAQAKQKRTRQGRRALAWHALSYGLTQAASKAAVYRVAGLRVPVGAQFAGFAVETLLHALVDDGRLLHDFAHRTGKGGFHDLTAAGINGRALMDQAAHQGLQIPVGAITTALLATRKDT